MQIGSDRGLSPSPPPEVAAEIALDAAEKTVYVGDTFRLAATVKNTDDAVSWYSSNAEVAAVSTDGTITVFSVGTAKVKATVDDKTNAVTVTVKPVFVGVNIEGIDDAAYYKGDEIVFDDLTPEFTPSGVVGQTDPVAFEVTSNNADIAEVIKNQTTQAPEKLMFKDAGEVTITIRFFVTGNARVGEAVKTVTKTVEVVGVSFASTAKQTLAVGEKSTREAIVTPDTYDALYSVKDGSSDVITVDQTTGEVTAVAVGTKTVVVTVQGGATAEYEVEVKALSLTCAAPENTLVWGDEFTFAPVLKLGDDALNGEYDFNIEYTGNVFAVDSENALKVKAVKVGTATLKIAATYNTVEVKTADMIVTVKDKIEIAFAENTAIRLSLEEVIYNDDFAATATAPTAAVKINGQASDGATIETFGYDKNMTYGGRTFYTDIFTTSYVSDAIGGKTPTGGFLKYTFGKQNNGNMGWGTNWLRLVIALKPSECGENSAMVNYLTALKKAGYTKVSFNLYFAVQADIVLKANTGTFVSNNKLGVAYNCGTQQGRVDISINEWSAFSVDIDHVIGNVTNKNVNSVYAVTAIEMQYGFEFFDATDKVDLYFGDIVAVKE